MFVVIAIYLHILLPDTIAAASDWCPVVGRLSQGEEQGEMTLPLVLMFPAFCLPFIILCIRLLLPPLHQCGVELNHAVLLICPLKHSLGGAGKGSRGFRAPDKTYCWEDRQGSHRLRVEENALQTVGNTHRGLQMGAQDSLALGSLCTALSGPVVLQMKFMLLLLF